MLLLDKGYYDYDFEKTDKPTTVVDWEKTVKSEDEVNSMLAGFGFGQFARKKPETIEEIQEHILKQI